jgi:hypothetical protein
MPKGTKGGITVVEAAKYLGIHPRSLHRGTKDRNFKVTHIGRRKYVEASEVRIFQAGELGPCKVKTDHSQDKALDTTGLISIPGVALCLGVHSTTIYRRVRERDYTR